MHFIFEVSHERIFNQRTEESMEKAYQDLLDKRNNITSQWGEDGLIEEIFRRIGTTNGYVVEFGAFDGKHLSNSWHLWHDCEWKALLIESDSERYAGLVSHVAGNSRVKTLNVKVCSEGEDSLDNLLRKMEVPLDIDLLSIDIDGDDYYILKGMRNAAPRLLVIEYNPTIPPNLDVVQAEGEYFGASALALSRMAGDKGYVLACMTNTNCLFVRRDIFPKLGIMTPDLPDIFPGTELTYVITSQAGMAYLSRQPVYAPEYSRLSLRNLFRRQPGNHPRLEGGDRLMPIRIFKP